MLPSSHVLFSFGAQTDMVVDCWSFSFHFFQWLRLALWFILLLEEHGSCCIHGSITLRLAMYIQHAKLSKSVINLDDISVDSPNVANAVCHVSSFSINAIGRSLPSLEKLDVKSQPVNNTAE